MICHPPINFIQGSKCVLQCEEDYLVIQGTNRCGHINRCKVPEYLKHINIGKYPFCVEHESTEENRNPQESPLKNCGDKVQNYITGQCETDEHIREKKYQRIGVYLFNQTVFVLESYLRLLLKQRVPQNQFPGYPGTDTFVCELIDIGGMFKECISQEQCLEFAQFCIRSERIDADRYKILDENDSYMDFNTGYWYSKGEFEKYIENRKGYLMIKRFPKEQNHIFGDTFEFCTFNENILNLVKNNHLNYGSSFIDSCPKSFDTKLGIYMINSQKCPFQVSNSKQKSCQQDQCESNKKMVNTHSGWQCVDCQRISIGRNLCADECFINKKFTNLLSDDGEFECTDIESGLLTFDFDSEGESYTCNFPRILSNDGLSCINRCPSGQVVRKNSDNDQFHCSTSEHNLDKIESYLFSSDDTRYTKDCYLIHEIQCTDLETTCQSRIGHFDKEKCGYDQTFIIKQIERNKDKIIEEFMFEKEHFMKEEFRLLFLNEPSDKRKLFQDISLMTHYSLLFSEKYAEYSRDGGNELIVSNSDKTIFIKVAALSNIGYEFKYKINFNQQLNENSIEIIKHGKVLTIKVLSYLFFKRYQHCFTNIECISIDFVMIEAIQFYEIEESFTIEFDLEDHDANLKEQNGKIENHYQCLSGKRKNNSFYSFEFKSKLSEIQNNGTNESIKCIGTDFVGLFFGKTDYDFTNLLWTKQEKCSRRIKKDTIV